MGIEVIKYVERPDKSDPPPQVDGHSQTEQATEFADTQTVTVDTVDQGCGGSVTEDVHLESQSSQTEAADVAEEGCQTLEAEMRECAVQTDYVPPEEKFV